MGIEGIRELGIILRELSGGVMKMVRLWIKSQSGGDIRQGMRYGPAINGDHYAKEVDATELIFYVLPILFKFSSNK
ncbi:MAG: hypothetical protein AAGF26_09215 [Cyanobacteria bacterium P01_G01_bin.49]